MARNDGTPGAAPLTTGLLIDGNKINSGDVGSVAMAANDTFYSVAVDPQLLKQLGQRAIEVKVKSTVILKYQGGGAGEASLGVLTSYQTLWVDKNGTVGALSTADRTTAIEYMIVMRNLPRDESI